MLLVAVFFALAGWIGFTVTIASAAAATSSVGWAIFWGLIAFLIPAVALLLDGMGCSSGCLSTVVIVAEAVAGIWSVIVLLMAASWAFGWAFLLALVCAIIWFASILFCVIYG